MKKKAYLSGAISGHPYEIVVLTFYLAEEYAKRRGYIPVSPLNNSMSPDATWEQMMERSIVMLSECDVIIFTPNWHLSKGCIREMEYAKKNDLEIVFTTIDDLNYPAWANVSATSSITYTHKKTCQDR